MIPQWTKNKEKGYIVESGSNANGEYIKFSDGTMICIRTITETAACNQGWGSLFVRTIPGPWDFAQKFISIPHVQITLLTTTSASCWLINYGQPSVTKTNFSNISIARAVESDSVAFKANIFAIGKWK